MGQVICLAVDSTSRAYDISKLAWNGVSVVKTSNRNEHFISLQCESNDVYFAFSSTAQGSAETIDDTASVTAGSVTALALPSTPFPPAHLVAGLPPIDVRLDRQVDVTLIVKCVSGKTATLRIWPSSQNYPGAE